MKTSDVISSEVSYRQEKKEVKNNKVAKKNSQDTHYYNVKK